MVSSWWKRCARETSRRLQSNHVPEKLSDARFVLTSEQMLLGFFSAGEPAGTRSFKQLVTVQFRSHRASALLHCAGMLSRDSP